MMLCSYSFMPNLESTISVINHTTILNQDEWNAAKIYHSISIGAGPALVVFTFFALVAVVYVCRLLYKNIYFYDLHFRFFTSTPLDWSQICSR